MNREDLMKTSLDIGDFLRYVRQAREQCHPLSWSSELMAASNAQCLIELALCTERMALCLEAIWKRIEADSNANWVKLAEAQAERKEGQRGN